MGRFLRNDQIESLTDERNRLTRMLESPHAQHKAEAAQQARAIDKQLAEQTPPDLNPEQRDRVAKKEAALRAEWMEGMPTMEEMRRNPPGAVGKHMAWEKKNKEKILLWKDLRRALHKGDPDPDLANIERYRPSGGPQELNMDGAQIPGKVMSFPSESYKEGYEEIFGSTGPEPTELDRVLDGNGESLALADTEKDDLRARIAALDRQIAEMKQEREKTPEKPKRKNKLSPEGRARLVEAGKKRAAENRARREAEKANAAQQEAPMRPESHEAHHQEA